MEKNIHGYLVAIYEPARITVATSKYLGKSGQYLVDISKANSSFIAINAGGFKDNGGDGNGGIPNGITIKNKSFVSISNLYDYNVIGFNSENKLLMGKYTPIQCQLKKIRDAVTFGPILIKNGQKSTIKGNGGGGLSPRSAIGQRADGIVLFLVLDGERNLGKGASYEDVQNIMENYGAVNSACLDGGTSTSLTHGNVLINNPSTSNGETRTRPISTAFILNKDEYDNGDYNVLEK